MEPVSCRSCERRQADYILNHAKSKYTDRQQGEIEDLSTLIDGSGYPNSVPITLTAQSAGNVSEGEWVKISGVTSAELRGETTIADIKMDGWAITSLPR